MKATGMIRGIDNLGRVVIPMEIRRNLGISSGDPLEIFTDNEGHIMLKKYDPSPKIVNQVKMLQDMINNNTNYDPEVINKAVGLLSELENLMKSEEK